MFLFISNVETRQTIQYLKLNFRVLRKPFLKQLKYNLKNI